MRRIHVWMFALVVSALVFGCSSDSGSVGGFDAAGGDTGGDADAGVTDVGDDAVEDTGSSDTSEDTSEDTGSSDTSEDTGESDASDAGGDVAEDVSEDAAGDTGTDAGADADAGGPTCEGVDCGPYGTCEEGDGGPFCACDEGFEDLGDGCQDIDECAGDEPLCGENEACINQPGDYLCACADGFVRSGDACVDVDECASGAMCDDGFTCRNLRGSMRCDCAAPNVQDGEACRPLRVLHLHDLAAEEGPIFEALDARGASVDTVRVNRGLDSVTIADALDAAADDIDLAIVDLPTRPLDADATDDALVAWLESGRRLIVYTYQLGELPRLTDRALVRPTAFTSPRSVVGVEVDGYNLFAQRGGCRPSAPHGRRTSA